MSDKLKLVQTTDMAVVKSIISDSDIWEQASQDGVSIDTYTPSNNSMCAWLLCSLGGDIIGLIYVHHDTNCALLAHPYLLKKHVTKGREMMKLLFKWFDTLPSTVCKLNVSIPSSRRIAYNFAKKVGFKDEGINRASIIKDGVVCDQYLLGLTREEIKGLI